MANNRMYLKCRSCGESIYIGGELMTPYWIDKRDGKNEDFRDDLNEFYEKHHYCYEGDTNSEINTTNQFTLAYEFLEDGDILVVEE